MANEMSLLQAIMVEEDDLDLFPPAVLEAYEDPKRRHAARKLLIAANAKETNAARKAKQAEFIDALRLWMEPITSAPGLSTLNGFGVRLYGSYQPGDDGTAIGTHWITALYLPVLPLGAYVYEGDGSGYQFYGRTPLPPRSWIAPALWGAAVAGLVGFGVVQGAVARRGVDVYVYNGLSTPVEVSAGEARTTVGPRTDGTMRVSVAVEAFEARSLDGTVLERVGVDLSDAGDHEAVYNVLGRAVIGSGWVSYGTATERPFTVLDAPLTVLDDDVFYAFRTPPNEIQTSSSGTSRSYLEVLDDADDPAGAMVGLMSQGMPDAAFRLGLAALAEGLGGGVGVDTMGFVIAISADPQGRCAEATSTLSDHVPIHRFCQDLGRREGWEGIQASYEALAAQHPQSSNHQYLLGRLIEDPEVGMTHFLIAESLDPENPWPVLAQAYHHHVVSGDLERALERYGRLEGLDPELFATRASDWVRLHRTLGRPVDLAVVEQADASIFSTADMLALEADPGRLIGELGRLRQEVPDDEAALANMQANAALIAGDLERLHEANGRGGGLDLWEALSDGGDLSVASGLAADETNDPGAALLLWTAQAMGGPPDDALLEPVRGYAPAVADALVARQLTEGELVEALVDVPPQLHGLVWFAAYRLTGERGLGAKAKAWALPQEVPYFTL